MLPDDDKRYAIETCRSSEKCFKKWFKINDIQLVHLLVVWYLVNKNVCFEYLYNFSLKHFPFLEKLIEIWQTKYIGFRVKCPLFLSDFNETWILSKWFSKNIHISNFMKIHPVIAELFHAEGKDGRTDMKLIAAIRNFATETNSHHLWIRKCWEQSLHSPRRQHTDSDSVQRVWAETSQIFTCTVP